ncbi:N-formylglutamate amidohydrolase [Lacibacterium aquatile]|uniref:N-formylglutamate amidohydrolase n=1 Tax=Lacibacterium aquatile TaxID=1168082 RepID=A0ABW5DW54_9PROT
MNGDEFPNKGTAPAASSGTALSIERPDVQTVPLVFSSPHSGRAYPRDFVANSPLGALALRRSEDAFLEGIYQDAPRHGAPLLHALFPRAYIDPNREPWELDPTMFRDPLPAFVNARSPRVAAGFGTIARIVSNGAEIYRAPLPFAEAEARVHGCYRPYHDALEGLLSETQKAFGLALLIDCHSMPSIGGPTEKDAGRRRVDFILGDCFGTSCASGVGAGVAEWLRGAGYSVLFNEPYAGGFITRHYGRPVDRRHALQIEVNRSLYMNEQTVEPNEGFGRLRQDMDRMMGFLAAEAVNLMRP